MAPAEPTLADQILANFNKDAEEQKKLQEEKEARTKRMADLFSNDDEVADDATLQRISQNLNFDFVKAKGELGEDSQNSEAAGARRSIRLRSGSLRSEGQAPVLPTSKRSSKAKDSEPARFFAEQRKLAKRVASVASSRRRSTSGSPSRADHPYPTPESDRLSVAQGDDEEGGAMDDDGRIPEMDLGVLGQNEDLGGVLDLARELQDSRRGSARRTAGSLALEWDGFWARDKTGAATPLDPSVNPSLPIESRKSGFGSLFYGLGASSLASLSAAGVHALRLWKSELSIPEQAFAGSS